MLWLLITSFRQIRKATHLTNHIYSMEPLWGHQGKIIFMLCVSSYWNVIYSVNPSFWSLIYKHLKMSFWGFILTFFPPTRLKGLNISCLACKFFCHLIPAGTYSSSSNCVHNAFVIELLSLLVLYCLLSNTVYFETSIQKL